METEEMWFYSACTNAVLLYLAPIYAPYSYLFTLLSLVLWMRYATDWGLDVLFRLSGFGTVMAAAYIVVFLCLSERGDPRRANLFCFGLGGAALLVGFDRVTPKTSFYNVVCCASACFASVAPFYNLPRAWLAKSMQVMPHVSLPILAFTNAILWIRNNIAGVAPEAIDYYLVSAAGVAGLCALLQLLLHAWFWCLPPPPPPPAAGLLDPLINKDEAAGDGLSPRADDHNDVNFEDDAGNVNGHC